MKNELIVRFHAGDKKSKKSHTLTVIERTNNKPREIKFNSLSESMEYIVNFYLKHVAQINYYKEKQPFRNCKVDIFFDKPFEAVSESQEVVKNREK